MLADIIYALRAHIHTRTGTDGFGRSVEYGLDGRVNTNRENGLLSSLEFDGTVMAFSPRRDGACGYGGAHYFFKGEKVIASAKLLAQELAGENYEVSHRLFDDSSIVIKKVGTHEELKKEIEEIRKVLTPSEEHSTINV